MFGDRVYRTPRYQRVLVPRNREGACLPGGFKFVQLPSRID
jgi:hypothetical protein